MLSFFNLMFSWLFKFPAFFAYFVYDYCNHIYYRLYMMFYGWGIHLFTGKFGQGKTSSMVIKAYELCERYPQLSVMSNLKLKNFPAHTKILPLKTAPDILAAPDDCLILIDEIGTIFNSRDFTTAKKGQRPVSKELFQHLCQCRKRRMMILATVQRFNLLDKQIRDISASVTACRTTFRHPFSRMLTLRTFDIEEYERYSENKTYKPTPYNIKLYIQTNKYRQLYDTTELIDGMLEMEYLDGSEILANRAENPSIFGDKATNKAAKRRPRY